MISHQFASRHFFAKFDNTGSGKEADIVSLLTNEEDVMVITKKHSGSLILIHSIFMNGQWHLVANSKNGTNNEFSIPAEYYLRAQFKAIFNDNAEDKFAEFVTFMGVHSITMSFEFVTTFLGDHGDTPLLSYAVLVAISQFDDENQTSRFMGVPEMVEVAVHHGLILNEMWIVSRMDAENVGRDLHELRWSGGDAEFTHYLDAHCAFKVHSMLPHGLSQGELLEGLVVQACRTSNAALSTLQELSSRLTKYRDALITGLRQFSSALPLEASSLVPPDHTGSVGNVTEFLQEISMDRNNEGSPLQQLFHYLLTELPQAKLRFFKFKKITRGNNISFIIHVQQDDIFFECQKKKPLSASQLYRGMEVYFQRELPTEDMSAVTPYQSTQSSLTWEILGISKWKNWNYLKRTFCMRNPLWSLFTHGHEAYLLQVKRQMQNWGLPTKYVSENLSLLSAWGNWMLRNNDAKNDFLKNKKGFSYLSYVNKFLPDYQNAPMLYEGENRVSSTLFVFYFERLDYSEYLAPLLKGYTPSIPEKNSGKHRAKYLPGNVYTFDHCRLPTDIECPSPYFSVVIPPSEDCFDRRALGMYESFCRQAREKNHKYPILHITNPKEEITFAEEELRKFNEDQIPPKKYLISMLAMQPGSGKSTLAKRIKDICQSRNINAVIVSSDHFGMKHNKSVRGKRTDGISKQEFEDAVVDALRCTSNEVVIYDKNIPNMPGYNCMKNVAARAGLLNLSLIPVVPDSCTQSHADVCISRVLEREHGTHTLTNGTEIQGYDSVVDFIQSIFTQQCMEFRPVASLLPQAVILSDFYSSKDIEALNIAAECVVEVICSWNEKVDCSPNLDLTAGTYLGLKFDLDDDTIVTIEQLVKESIRRNVHVTIQFYGEDGDKMLKASSLLKSHDIFVGSTRDVCITRIGQVVDIDEATKSVNRMLVWASCIIDGFNDLPLHVTLLNNGFQNVDARSGELAFDSKVVNIDGVDFTIHEFSIDPITFVAMWAVE